MRKDDWITKLYYKQLSDKSKSNNSTRENVSSEKKISRTQDKLECRKRNNNT